MSEHNENWMERALNFAEQAIVLNGELKSPNFTGEDIRFLVANRIGEPRHPNAYGALVSTLIKRNIIVPTGEYRAMKDNTSHARKTPVYKAYENKH